jgi:hypothetical protein
MPAVVLSLAVMAIEHFDEESVVRRVHLDLHGLLPTAEVVQRQQ